jgi:hypothetical protein
LYSFFLKLFRKRQFLKAKPEMIKQMKAKY